MLNTLILRKYVSSFQQEKLSYYLMNYIFRIIVFNNVIQLEIHT